MEIALVIVCVWLLVLIVVLYARIRRLNDRLAVMRYISEMHGDERVRLNGVIYQQEGEIEYLRSGMIHN